IRVEHVRQCGLQFTEFVPIAAEWTTGRLGSVSQTGDFSFEPSGCRLPSVAVNHEAPALLPQISNGLFANGQGGAQLGQDVLRRSIRWLRSLRCSPAQPSMIS